MRQLDDTDRAIISHLQYDGRMPFTEIAGRVGLSEGTVRRRVKRLTGAGVLQIVGIVEPQFLDWQAVSMVGVSVHPGGTDAAARQIAQFPKVTYLMMCSGGFDLFAEVCCRDRRHFVSFLNEKLQQVPGVERTETSILRVSLRLLCVLCVQRVVDQYSRSRKGGYCPPTVTATDLGGLGGRLNDAW